MKGEKIMAQRTVDVHNHWYPKEYLDYLCSRGSSADPYMQHDGGVVSNTVEGV